MGVVETVKEVAGLIQKYDNVDLIKRVVELQQQVYDLVNENRVLKEHLATRDQLVFRKNAYWKGDDGPLCSRCWDAEGIPVRMTVRVGYDPACPKCKATAPDPDAPPLPLTFGGVVPGDGREF